MVVWTEYPITIQDRDGLNWDACSLYNHQSVYIPVQSKSKYAKKLLIFGGIFNDSEDFDELIVLEPYGLKVAMSLAPGQGNRPISRKGHQLAYLDNSSLY